MAVAVRGLRELNQTFKHAPKDVKRELRDEYRTVAEPVRSTAATLAASSIRNIGAEVVTDANRCHATTRLRRPETTRRQNPWLRRAPAAQVRQRCSPNAHSNLRLERNRHRIERDFDQMLDKLVHKWDREGP